jgi:hypothetical protein
MEANSPRDLFRPTTKENEMKLQILDEGLDSNREGEQSVSFFNEIDIGTRTILENPGSIPRPMFHFVVNLTQKQELRL